jgi:hypothetical protein
MSNRNGPAINPDPAAAAASCCYAPVAQNRRTSGACCRSSVPSRQPCPHPAITPAGKIPSSICDSGRRRRCGA